MEDSGMAASSLDSSSVIHFFVFTLLDGSWQVASPHYLIGISVMRVTTHLQNYYPHLSPSRTIKLAQKSATFSNYLRDFGALKMKRLFVV